MNPRQSYFREVALKPSAKAMRIEKAVCTLLALMVFTTLSFAQLTYTTTCECSPGGCYESDTCTYSNWEYKDSSGVEHSFPGSDSMTIVEDKFEHMTDLDTFSTDGLYYLTAIANDGTVEGVSTFDPLYKVVSILYSPPGNQSGQGYGTATTNGTVTTVGSSFTFSSVLTFSSGVPGLGEGNTLGGSASVGYATTSFNSSAFTQTWIDAQNITSDDNSNLTYNPNKSDAINHNLDEFVIWLNPEVVVSSSVTTPTSYAYNVGSQVTAGLSTTFADMVIVPAVTMEATPAGATGVTTVPLDYLIPQAIIGTDGANSYMPGLAAICANQTLYKEQLAADLANPANPSVICTVTNQCGCVPSDFVNILQTDPLLNYNGTTLTATPYVGTTDPLTLDPSGASVCGENPVPTTASCRYQIVPIVTGSTTPLSEPLSGDSYPTYTMTDTTSTTETTGHTDSHSVGLSFGGGILVASLKTEDTWTWTDSESWGQINGTSNSMFVTLKTSNADCTEEVAIYEDTEFHTFAFQVPTLTACP